MQTSDVILVVSGILSLLTIIGLFVRLTWFIGEEFKKHRVLVYEVQTQLNNRILRLEYWAVSQRTGFQPGADVLPDPTKQSV